MCNFEPYDLKHSSFPKGKVESGILKTLKKLKHDFAEKKVMTRNVKLALVKLGHQRKHKVYARGYLEVYWTEKDNDEENWRHTYGRKIPVRQR